MYLLYRKTFCNICFCTVYKTYRLLILNLNWWNKQHYTPAQRIQFSSSLTKVKLILLYYLNESQCETHYKKITQLK